ncbi:MAG: hypothetical protein MUF15_08750 [Acidobacteria bacterium]|jgi:hypothetical protein|nr:hypothetical protein [Acidobacteriota bacterium]
MKIENFGKKIKTIPLAPGTTLEEEYEEGEPIVRFDFYTNPFVMSQVICNNPGCECKDITLGFTEIDESGIPLKRPFTFSLSLDLDTWQEGKTFKQSKISQGFIDEFIKDLTDEMKTRFMENYQNCKRKFRNAQKFKMSVAEIKQGALVSYMDVFGDTGSILSGGKDIGLFFKNNGDMYFIHDLYCVNPNCKCDEVHLGFFKYEQAFNSVREIFICRLPFKNKVKVYLMQCSCTKEEAIEIFQKWWKSESATLIGLLKMRYKEMKEIGQKLFSRNDMPGRVKKKRS